MTAIDYRAKCPTCGNVDARYVCETTDGHKSAVARIDCSFCDAPKLDDGIA